MTTENAVDQSIKSNQAPGRNRKENAALFFPARQATPPGKKYHHDMISAK